MEEKEGDGWKIKKERVGRERGRWLEDKEGEGWKRKREMVGR